MSTVTAAAAADVQQDVVEKLNGMRSVCTTSEHLIGGPATTMRKNNRFFESF